jgi:hypothetical protein
MVVQHLVMVALLSTMHHLHQVLGFHHHLPAVPTTTAFYNHQLIMFIMVVVAAAGHLQGPVASTEH